MNTMDISSFSKAELLKIYTALFVMGDEALMAGFTLSPEFTSALDKVRKVLTD